MREVRHLDLARFLPHLLDRKDRMSMAGGLEVRGYATETSRRLAAEVTDREGQQHLVDRLLSMADWVRDYDIRLELA